MSLRLETNSVCGVADEITVIITKLQQMDVPALQKRWSEVYGHPSPRRSRADLLRRGIAYAEQAKRYGGLDPDLRDQLRKLAKNNDHKKSGTAIQLKGNARLVREWRGTMHQVDVVGEGFMYQGRRYKSLSKIAREITGTAWSGPVFFGLKKKSTAS